MRDQDVDRHEQVGARHERDDDLGDAGDLLQAAEDDDPRQGSDHDPDHELGCPEGALHGVGDRVRLDGVEDQAEGEDQADREDVARPGCTQAARDVEGRAAAVLAVIVGDLVELGQRALGIGRGHADQGHHPHPEDRTRTAQIERHRHAGDVAGADPRGEADGQRLEGRDAGLVGLLRARDHPEHLAEMHDLHEAETPGEVDADGQEAVDEDVAPEDRVQEPDDRFHGGVCSPFARGLSERDGDPRFRAVHHTPRVHTRRFRTCDGLSIGRSRAGAAIYGWLATKARPYSRAGDKGEAMAA